MKTKKALIIAGICTFAIILGYVVSEKLPLMSKANQDTNLPHITIGTGFVQEWMERSDYVRSTPYGNYLIGNFAQKEKDWDAASDYIERVLEKDKTDDLLKHAMVLAMGAGETEKSISLAKQVLEQKPNDLLATIFVSAENFKTLNYTAAKEALKPISKDSIAAFIVPVLDLWADASKNEFQVGHLGSNTFFIYQVMMAGDYLGKQKEALAFANKKFSLSATDLRDLEKIADYYVKFGNLNKAADIYGLLVKEKLARDEVKEKLERLKKKESIEALIDTPVIKSPKDGAAQVFLSMGEILLREESLDSSLIFTQMALYLDENSQEARLLLARILTTQEQYDDAIAIYEAIPKEHKNHVMAQRGIANLLVEKKQNSKAIKILESIYQEHEDLEALIQIGDIYRYEENYADAVKTYDRVTKKFETVPEKFWHVLYARGMAYERLKKFKESEEDLLAALRFRPNHPYLLNYLGYSWADQGIKLEKAQEMINKAFELKPDDGYIADSVGWVHFKQGNYEDSIQYLETAVELLPYDATINDHLGDAYWKVGRQTEAKFQWQRAFNNSKENEEELKEKIFVKLSYGYMSEEKITEYIKITKRMSDLIEVLAPAKVNLFLHVIGKQKNGYHLLQSQIMFADFGDKITIEYSDKYQLQITGSFSKNLEIDENLVTRAAHSLCKLIKKEPNLKITLEKNIPIGAGLGGGSSDAAATIKGLISFFNTDVSPTNLESLLINLGADAPACFYAKSCFIEGIGEVVNPMESPSLYAVLVYPNTHCATAPIFKNYDQKFSDEIDMKENLKNDFINFIKKQKNDLTQSALSAFPEIKECLKVIEDQENVLTARMSGSGSSCFGIFENIQQARKAKHTLKETHPDWWVQAVTLS